MRPACLRTHCKFNNQTFNHGAERHTFDALVSHPRECSLSGTMFADFCNDSSRMRQEAEGARRMLQAVIEVARTTVPERGCVW